MVTCLMLFCVQPAGWQKHDRGRKHRQKGSLSQNEQSQREWVANEEFFCYHLIIIYSTVILPLLYLWTFFSYILRKIHYILCDIYNDYNMINAPRSSYLVWVMAKDACIQACLSVQWSHSLSKVSQFVQYTTWSSQINLIDFFLNK